ncbi:MAG: RNA polymerase sigma factor [Solirubrobacteraceae bacterium]
MSGVQLSVASVQLSEASERPCGRLVGSLTRSSSESTRSAAREDQVSVLWLTRLRADGSERRKAVSELRELLLRAARFELNRRSVTFPQLRGGDLDDLAQQSADDALVAILGKLDEFRGESRFTTWAYKFALYEAASKLRRRAWQGREVPLEPEAWARTIGTRPGPDKAAETTVLLNAVVQEIQQSLSPHQREVLTALVLNDVPIDVLAERLNTTRGALYKSLHDARRKLRAGLAGRGLNVSEQEEGQ